MGDNEYSQNLRGRKSSNNYESSRKTQNRKSAAANELNFDYTPLRSNSPKKDDIKYGVVNLSSNN
jgi:hypothetical protein